MRPSLILFGNLFMVFLVLETTRGLSPILSLSWPESLGREFRKTGSLTDSTRLEQHEANPGPIWPNAGNHVDSNQIVAT